ncbi:hypothetical protein BHM03_00010304 [Ensete ventricosum]|nr:hypothetical protein BHM03_00010304 [Ensete ventricosum]
MLWFQYIPGDRIKEEMRNVDVLSEDRLNELLQSFLNDFKERKLEENGWPTSICAYKVSKVAVSAYTRILAKKYPNICINCVHPGVVKTDMNCNTGELPVEEGAQRPVVTAKGEDEEAAVVKVCFPFFPDFRTTMLRSLLWRCRDDAERDLHRRGEATELLL